MVNRQTCGSGPRGAGGRSAGPRRFASSKTRGRKRNAPLPPPLSLADPKLADQLISRCRPPRRRRRPGPSTRPWVASNLIRRRLVARFEADGDRVLALEGAAEDLLGERVFDACSRSPGAAAGRRSRGWSPSRSRNSLASSVRSSVQAAVGQAAADLGQLDVDDLLEVVSGQASGRR